MSSLFSRRLRSGSEPRLYRRDWLRLTTRGRFRINEIVVRHCHVIAPSRQTATAGANGGAAATGAAIGFPTTR